MTLSCGFALVLTTHNSLHLFKTCVPVYALLSLLALCQRRVYRLQEREKVRGMNDRCVCVLWGFGTTVNVTGAAYARCACVYVEE